MERDAVACCHYTNRDCSRNSRNDDVVIFRLYLYFMNGSSDARIAKCTTGGALIIRGTQHNYHGECIDVNGVSTMFLLEKEHTYGSPPQTTKST
ncbi:hypothetical protein BDF21DRAFT_458574 [Thamnidium elegans]|nr:hypothetical protein BDF21DRAFT_458574 [Thamnidium elegans]